MSAYPFAAATYSVVCARYDDHMCDMVMALWPWRHDDHWRGVIRTALSFMRKQRGWRDATRAMELAWDDIHKEAER